MRAALLRPLTDQRQEVPQVEGDQDPLLVGGKHQHLRVADAFQFPVLVQREDIVSLGPQPAGDDASRDVRIQEQAQLLADGQDLDEGVLLA